MTALSPDTLPDTHRVRVLELLAAVGVTPEADNVYTAHNGVVRVKVARMTGSQWSDARSKLTREMYARDWIYGVSHSEFFIEPCDELTFRPPEAMR